MNKFCDLAETIHGLAEYFGQLGDPTDDEIAADLDEVEVILLDLAASAPNADCL